MTWRRRLAMWLHELAWRISPPVYVRPVDDVVEQFQKDPGAFLSNPENMEILQAELEDRKLPSLFRKK